MSSGRSSFKTAHVICRDIRRFWVLPLVIFLTLFCSTCAQMILRKDIEYLIAEINHMEAGLQLAVTVLGPVVSALVVFHYLHRTDETIAYHSLPLTRPQLFTGHLLAGALFFIVPAVVNSLILAVLAHPVFYEDDNGTRVNVFTLSEVFTTLVIMIVTMLFVYALSVLAGMVTGTVLMHAIGAVGLNILAPALYLFIKGYLELFLKGYSVNLYSSGYTVLTPVTGLSGWDTLDHLWLRVVIYLIIALLLFSLSFRLYRIRKLETATDNLTYTVMVPIVTGIITFFAASFIADMISDRHFIPVLACITVLVYISVRMFILKTTRIFSRRMFVSFGIYCVLFAMFISSLSFDISGYEKKMPDLNDVKSAGTNVMSWIDLEQTTDDVTFKDRENIKRVYRIHERLINAEKDKTSFGLPMFDGSDEYDLSIRYDCGSRDMRRMYDVDNAVLLKTDRNVKALYESKEYKKIISPYSIKGLDIEKAGIDVSSYITGDDLSVSDPDDKESLLAAMDRDISARTFEQALDMSVTSAVGAVYIETKKNGGSYVIYRTDKNTMDWLDAHGYHDEFDAEDMVIESVSAAENREGGGSADLTKGLAGMSVSDFLDTYGSGAGEYEDYKVTVSLTVRFPGSNKLSVFDLYYGDGNMPDFLTDIKWE